MVERNQKSWLAVLIVGAFYCLIGFSFGVFATWSSSFRVVFAWRLASFIVSAVAFALHIGYEHFRLASKPLTVGLRTALAVALGAFGLVVAANIHALGVPNSSRGLLVLALVIWPLMTGMPAFVIAMISAAGLGWLRRR